MLLRNKNTCGTKARRLRRSARPIVATSMPSITMRPPEGSTMRYNAIINVLFPHPVRPATPIYAKGFSLSNLLVF